MKNSNAKYYSVLLLVLGAVGLLLYRCVMTGAIGADGLVIRYTLPEIVLWALTACAAVLSVVLTRKCTVGQSGKIPCALGSLIYALGVVTLFTAAAKGPAPLVMIYRGVAGVTILSLVVTAVLRLLGKEPHYLLSVGPCLLGVMQLVECYQLWSERPLVLKYFFGLGAVLSVMVFSYHAMARAAKLPYKALYGISGLLGAFFCCVAVGQGDFAAYFAAAALWITAEMTALTPEA